MPISDGETETIAVVHQGIPQIPFDLFVKKNYNYSCEALRRPACGLRFTDAFGNLVYQVHHHRLSLSSSSPSARHKSVLFDASGNPLLSIFRSGNGSWKGFNGDSGREQDLLLRVERTLNTFSKIELDIFLTGPNGENSTFKMRGCLFWRSCTIYQDNAIVAQTSLMYKLGLGKVFVRRSKFRVTLFPGFADHTFIAALILIFLDGRK
ncbi:hypothetical protein Ancab_007174 [Ancistrocladus abbreviatus]